jgi:hypothetical protein
VYSKQPGKILETKEIGYQLLVLPKYYLATEKANAFTHPEDEVRRISFLIF